MQENNSLANYLKDPIASKFFDLILGRVFKRVYLDLDQEAQKNVQQIFFSGSDKEKEEFVKKYIPNFDMLFEEEAEKIKKELEVELA